MFYLYDFPINKIRFIKSIIWAPCNKYFLGRLSLWLHCHDFNREKSRQNNRVAVPGRRLHRRREPGKNARKSPGETRPRPVSRSPHRARVFPLFAINKFVDGHGRSDDNWRWEPAGVVRTNRELAFQIWRAGFLSRTLRAEMLRTWFEPNTLPNRIQSVASRQHVNVCLTIQNRFSNPTILDNYIFLYRWLVFN